MNTKLLVTTLVTVFLANYYCEGAHVVFLQHVVSYSHIVATMPLAETLLRRGHNVTYISNVPSSSPNPNIPHIVVERLKIYLKGVTDEVFDISTRLEGRLPNLMLIADDWNVKSCDILLASEEFQSWMKSTAKVDLIYVDSYPECAFGIAHKLKAKLAIFQPLPVHPKFFDNFGIPTESSSIPTWTLPFKTPLSFFNRVKNTLSPIGWIFTNLYYWSSMESVLKNNLNITDLPSMEELYKSICLVLMNGHFLDEQRRSLPPMFVNAPGLHVQETHKPLPKGIQEFVDSKDEDGNPSEGFVYVSFGTLAKAKLIPQNIRETIFNSMKAFPNIRFLWRWEGEFPSDRPKNLYLSQWFNQQDLLGNSKIRGFVTQIGRPSSQEAVYNAVPMITFPILGDQDYNADMLESLGVSINLEIGDITEDILKDAMSTILHNETMKERCVEVSKLYKDLPMKPIDTAVWWTEYVLRHKDFSHLKPLAIDQTWYQRRLLDVWAFLTISFLLIAFLTVIIFRFCFKLIASLFLVSRDKTKQN